MNMPASAAEATIGHNQPPSDAELLQDKLAASNAQRIERYNQLMDAVDRAPKECADEETAGKLADMTKLLTACAKDFETSRVGEKEPYLTLSRMVDGFFRRYTDALEAAKKKLNTPLSNFMVEKERKQRAEAAAEEKRKRDEADRLAREAAEQEAAKMPELAAETMSQAVAADKAADKLEKKAEAPAADLSRTRGNFGSVASLRKKWVAENINFQTIDLEALREHIPRDAIEKAANAWARRNQSNTLKGALVHEVHDAAVR